MKGVQLIVVLEVLRDLVKEIFLGVVMDKATSVSGSGGEEGGEE